MANIRLGDYGGVVRAVIQDQDGLAVDVSGASTKQLHLEDPAGAVQAKDAAFTTDGTDGKIQYTLQNGDITLAGWWSYQGYVILPAGLFRSAIARFEVKDNL